MEEQQERARGAHPDGWCEYWQAQRAASLAAAEDRRTRRMDLALFLFAVAIPFALWICAIKWLAQ